MRLTLQLVVLVAPVAMLGAADRTVAVADAAQLKAAFVDLQDGDTILIADGTYRPDRVLIIGKDRVTVRGGSGTRDAVVLDGTDQGSGQMMWFTAGAQCTLADLTIENVATNAVAFKAESGPIDRPTVRNVRFRNIWERALKGTRPPDEASCPRGGLVEGCLFEDDHPKELPDSFDGDYIAGIDLMGLRQWTVRGNTFRGIRGRNGGGRGAIFVWVDSRDVLIENNVVVGCDRGIALGNPHRAEDAGEMRHVTRAVVRNNVVVRGADKAIELAHAADCALYNNTVWSADPAANVVHVMAGCADVRFFNNLVRCAAPRFDAEVDAGDNVFAALEGAFVAPGEGDVHLTAAGMAIARGKGRAIPDDRIAPRPRAPVDVDGRELGGPLDLGADQVE
ncbi:MAG TPA: right-handed parallel beta-helix repeat-containing protein [Planctomycetota bacterium]|nr:right-handed parallel beta-helix repeat-containing protein [Planctomycetota bacterium]